MTFKESIVCEATCPILSPFAKQFIFTFFLYIEAISRLSGSNNGVNTFQGGTFFFDLFVLLIIGLTITVIYLESHNKNKVLHVFKK